MSLLIALAVLACGSSPVVGNRARPGEAWRSGERITISCPLPPRRIASGPADAVIARQFVERSFRMVPSRDGAALP